MIYCVKTKLFKRLFIDVPDKFIVPKEFNNKKLYPAPKAQFITHNVCTIFSCGDIFKYTGRGFEIYYDNIKNLDRNFLLYIIDENIKYTSAIEQTLRMMDDGVEFLYSDALQKLKEEILAHDDSWIKDIATIKDIIE